MSSRHIERHESARGHVTGRAVYTDEQLAPTGMLCVHPVQSAHAHARIVGINATTARGMSGVVAVLTAADIPGENNTGPIVHDEPLMPSDLVQFHGQAVAWVVASDEASASTAAAAVEVRYEVLQACCNLTEAMAKDAYFKAPATVSRGDADTALASATHRLDGELTIGGQDHFYLETQASWAVVDSEGLVQVTSSTQHPTETQIIVARVLGLPSSRVVCRSLRMGGGFGGKETQANPYAAIVALAAHVTGRPVRIKLPRSIDMQMTGKRHPFFARYAVGFDDAGALAAIKVRLVADGGWSTDLSPPVLMRAMAHVDNAYFCPHVHIEGLIAKTHLPSNTAFRGFGGPQGMLIGEEIIDRIARHLGLPPDQVRERNFYREDAASGSNVTPYGQTIIDFPVPELWQRLKTTSEFESRQTAIAAFNATHANVKRGIAITPVKFGISFNKTEYNQAGALVHIYTDGSIQLNHGGTEMGQGLHSKMLAVASRALGVDVERIQIMVTSTDKVPNTSATAASSGSDLNGQAVRAACETLLARLAPIAAGLLESESDDIIFADDVVFSRVRPDHRIGFVDVIRAAYEARVSLSATGFYRTPGLSWDAANGRGQPFYYFACGAAVSEVEICVHTGVHRLLRVDILHDVGDSLVEAIDRGQIEGGFVQGLGWLTCEELRWSDAGKLLTDAPSTYKIPTNGEVAEDFRVALYRSERVPAAQVIFGSKAVGEPPLMLALSVREALRAAIAACGNARAVPLASPATPEAIFYAIMAVRGASQAAPTPTAVTPA